MGGDESKQQKVKVSMLLDSWSIANSPKCWNGEIAFLDVDHIVVLCSIAGVSVLSSEV